MKVRTTLIGVTLTFSAYLGLGILAATPALAVGDCAPGTHYEMSGSVGSCVPDQSKPDQTAPAPQPTSVPTSDAPKPTVQPTTPSTPGPTQTSTQTAPAPVPTQTIFVTTTASPPEPSSSQAAPMAPLAPEVPGPVAPVQQLPGSPLIGPSTDTKPTDADNATDTPTSAVEAEQLQHASTDDPARKAWAIGISAALLALAAAIIVYSVKRFGSPFQRQH